MIQLSKHQKVVLQTYDRVVMGTDITLFIDPKNMPKVHIGWNVGTSHGNGDTVETILFDR